jgi:hypothetical protein
MSEGVAAQIMSIVRHELSEAHSVLAELLARLDQAPAANGREKVDQFSDMIHIHGSVREAPLAIAALSRKPSTIERRERAKRARQRQAANRAAAPVTAPADPWPTLRTEFHAEIQRRHLSHAQVAAELTVSAGSVSGWSARGGPPSAANIARIRAWLDKPAPLGGERPGQHQSRMTRRKGGRDRVRVR